MQLLLVNGDYFKAFLKVGNAQGFEYPTTKVSVEDLAGPQSALYVTSKAGRRLLSWDALIDNTDIDIVELQRAARPGSLKELFFTSCHGDLKTNLEILSLTMPYVEAPRRSCHVEAVCPDWRFYSIEEHNASTLESSISGGMAIPASIPYDIGSPTIIETIITNAGSESSTPRFIIYGPGTSFTITNLTTGEAFTIDYSISDTDYIHVNVQDGTIFLNDDIDIYSSLTSGLLWNFGPSQNEIRFQASGKDITTRLEIFWRDAYGGI